MRHLPFLILALLAVTLGASRMTTDDERDGGYVLKPSDYMATVTANATNTTNGTSGNRTNSSSPSNTTANSTKGGNTTIPTNQTGGGNSTKTNTTTNSTGNSTKGGNSTNSTSGNSTKPGNSTNNNSTNNNSTKPANGTNGTATNGTTNVTKGWLKYNNTCFGCVVSGFKYCSQSRTCISLAENCTGNLTQNAYTSARSCPVQTECKNFGINGLVFVSSQDPVQQGSSVSNFTTNLTGGNNSANNTPVVYNKGSQQLTVPPNEPCMVGFVNYQNQNLSLKFTNQNVSAFLFTLSYPD